jgi:hypothetical protein
MKDMMAVFKEFHESGKFEKSFNAVEIKDFRPISLVSGVLRFCAY